MRDDERFLEKKIDGETVYEGRILDLEVDRVRLPNGNETVREVVRHRGAAVMLPLLDTGEIVFVRQYRYPMGELLLELPAGKLDPGESAETCARRELEEETGWRAGTMTSLGWFYTTPGFSDEILHAFFAGDLVAVEHAERDPDEIIEIVTMSVDDALEACRNGAIRDSKTVAALFLARLNDCL
ncbi:MAG: NUDIX hydrolase [Holophagae bacterium]|jgi:ADP-ribose pyrophosphatase